MTTKVIFFFFFEKENKNISNHKLHKEYLDTLNISFSFKLNET